MASKPLLGLLESVGRWVFANLPYDRNNTGLVIYLNGLDADETLAVFHNWSHLLAAYLKNGGMIENSSDIANHSSTRTTQLYDRHRDEVTLGEVERIFI